MFGKIGSFAVKYKIWIILGWVIVAVLMYLFAPSLNEVGTMKEATFLPKDSESLRARELIEQYFPQSKSTSTISLVFYNPQKLGEGDMAYARQVRDWLSSGETPFEVANVISIFDNPLLASRLVSPDGTTMLLNAGLEQAAFESKSMDTAKSVRDYLQSAPEGLEIYVSGQVGIYADLFASLNKSIQLTTLITAILLVVLLIIIYRSPVAVLVPLVTIVIAFLVARGTLGLIGRAGVSIWSQLDVFLIVLVFGIGTDYCLFLVSRFREELGRRDSRTEAMKFTVSRIGAVIGASALAVIVGLAGMAVARYQMIQTMGPVLGIAIFITLLAALTLAPSLASIFGRKLFWPRHDDAGKDKTVKHSGFWDKIARFSTGRPIIVIGIVLILMLLPYFAIPKLNRSFDQLSEIPPGSESVAGFRILEKHFDIGEMDPLTAVIVAPEGQKFTDPAALAALSKISTDLLALDGVVKVQSVVQPEGTGQTPAGLTVSGQLAGIGEGIIASLSSTSSDPSILFSDNVTAGFTTISGYLGELAQNFPWVKDEASYQAVLSDLPAIGQTIAEIKTEALVENQLMNLSIQINNAGQALAKPGATLTPESIGLFTLLYGYLDELAGQYPAIKSEPGYQTAYPIITTIGSALVSSLPPDMLPPETQEVMSSLPDYLQQLSFGLDKIADHFRASNDYLFSQALARASTGPSPMDTLQSQFYSLNNNLQILSDRFEQNGNPAFFSTSLMASSAQAVELMDMFFSQDLRATKLYIVLGAYPQSDKALTTVVEARKTITLSLVGTTLNKAEAVIGGTSAELSDVRQILDEDFNRVLIVVIVAIFVVLALLLRSLIAPLYLLLTVLLSYGTTLGIVSWIFQSVLGQDGISFMIPIIVFVLLVALGSDYNIFLMSRVREESATQPTRYGARLAAIATGGVITACGIILAGTFGVLVITPIRTLMQIGAAVAIGVLIDTFLVRALLVPAIASLLGRWNWWPTRHG
jgi:RND superfamily putative drug exporter